MSIIAESFISQSSFSEAEVQEAIGSAKKVRKLGSNGFDGPIAAWARDRARLFEETIIPRHVYVVELPKNRKHRLAWIYHEGFDKSNKPFCQHEIACDCSGVIEEIDTPEEAGVVMRDCPGMGPALAQQATAVNRALQIDDILQYALKYHKETPMDEQSDLVKEFVGSSLVHLLKNDFEYPRSWIANVESGWTMTHLASSGLPNSYKNKIFCRLKHH
jgi:hypothetical protein